MTVYVDDMQRPARVGRLNAVWSHLTADTDEELHEFAARLGLKRTWHQKPGTPISHYDVTEPKRQQAIRLGAVPIGYMSEESKNLIRRKIAQRSDNAEKLARHSAYRQGRCVDCKTAEHSAGRPRCDNCHTTWARQGGVQTTVKEAPRGA